MDTVVSEMADTTSGADDAEDFEQDEPTVRRENFDADGPVEIDVALGSGRVSIALVEEPGVSVEVRYDPSVENPWMQGISSMLNWFGGQFGQPSPADAPAAAVRETRIDLSGQRLVVHAPKR